MTVSVLLENEINHLIMIVLRNIFRMINLEELQEIVKNIPYTEEAEIVYQLHNCFISPM